MAAPEPITTYNGGAEPQLDATISITSILGDNDDGTILQGQDTTVEGTLATNGTLAYQLPYQDGGGVSSLKLFARAVSADGVYGASVFLGNATLTDTGQTSAGEEVYDWSAQVSTATLASGIYDLEAFAYTTITAADPDFPIASFPNTNSHPDFEYISVVPSDNESAPAAPIAADAGSGELSEDGRYFVYTSNAQTYEMDLQEGTTATLSAGETPAGIFAAGQTINTAALHFEQFQSAYGSLDEIYTQTITSANGAYRFTAIGDDHPYNAQALQPYDDSDYYTGYDAELYPVVTNVATGLSQLLTGFGTNPSPDDGPEGIPVAVSDDGTTVLVENIYLNGLGDEAGSGYYIVHLPAATNTATPDIFSANTAATSGALAGEYLWSNAANWSAGLPVNGDNVTLAGYGIDDIATLSLAGLDAGENGADITGGELTVDTLQIGADAAIEADSEKTGGAVTVIIGSISGTGAFVDAKGAGASVVLSDNVTQAEHYRVYDGGEITLDNLAAGSDFEFEDGGGTLALATPAATIAASISGITPGDVLELPGSAVSAVNFGNTLDSVTTLSITTSSGTYVFTEAGYETGAGGYIAEPDAGTGLVAITFTGSGAGSSTDVFSDTATASSGQFLWSNAANWSGGVPGNNAGVSLTAAGIDDLAALSLTSLATNGALTSVDGSLLSIGTLITDSASGLLADSELAGGSTTVSVILGSITGSGALFVADGENTSIEILDATVPDEIYQAEAGGRIVLDSLSSGSGFGFVGNSTLALVLPGAETDAAITGVGIGDVLELSGTAVSGVSFGAHSLEVTTSSGIYDFTNVTFGAGVADYTAGLDATTGLEAITFAAAPQDVFQTNLLVEGGSAPPPFTNEYAWSDIPNWASGALPQNGDAVTVKTPLDIDDIHDLSLSTLNDDGEIVAVENLTISALVNSGALIAQGDFGPPYEGDPPNRHATITVDNVTDTENGAEIGADGTGGVAIVNAPVDGDGFLFADGGGLLELTTAPGAAALSYLSPFLDYFNGAATIALEDPGATFASALEFIRLGDVLELPGTVTAVDIGTASLTIVTNTGTTTFSDASFYQPITGYTVAQDSATGLDAITFTGPAAPGVETFSSNYLQADPLLGPGELWSTDSNWSALVPRDGAAVEIQYTTGKFSIDNIDNLSLTSLSEDTLAQVIIGDTLEVGSLSVAATASFVNETLLTVDGNIVNNGQITDYGTLIAGGAVTGSGTLELEGGAAAIYGSVAAGQTINFEEDEVGGGINGSRLELFDPGSIIAASIDNLTAGDVLELPGSTVENIVFGASSLTISTDKGVFDFTSVAGDIAGLDVDGYTASQDAATGLEVISLTGRDVFYDNGIDLSAAYYNQFVWSESDNWSQGVPASGASVDISAAATDDIANLSLGTVDVSASTLTVAGNLNAGALYVAAGASLSVLASAIVTAQTVNDGQISTDPSSIIFDGAVTGTGSITISAGSTITFNNSVASTETIINDGTLVIGDPSVFAGQVTGSGVEIIICYLRGTRIKTRKGTRKIETLRIGDEVATKFGGMQKIKWIGRQPVSCVSRAQMPVRITAGALGANLPQRDLFVSPGHSMLLDGVLVLAKALVNGITITQTDMQQDNCYYQLEFAAHDCILAEGAWSESYADCGALRRNFENAVEFYALYPRHRAPAEPLLCAPRPQSGPTLAAALLPVVAQAKQQAQPGRLRGYVDHIGADGVVSGWAQDEGNPECPVLLEITLGSEVMQAILACDYRRDLLQAGIAQGRSGFTAVLPVHLSWQALPRVSVRRAGGADVLPLTPDCLSGIRQTVERAVISLAATAESRSCVSIWHASSATAA